MLQASNLSKSYGDNLLFDKVNLVINRGDRVGLVGPNGCGKTTLLRLLIGAEEPDRGAVRQTAPGVQIGYLPQALSYDPSATVREVLSGTAQATTEELSAQVAELAQELATQDTLDDATAEEYAALLEQLSLDGVTLPEYLIEQVLAGLGLRHVHPATPVRILSGGQKTRLGLARLLLADPTLLILDEPTNHLDITALEWLEGYLARYKGGMLLVSHDRTFLDRTVTRILEMDPVAHTVKAYEGDYTEYTISREREQANYLELYKAQEERVAGLKAGINTLKGQARNIEHETIAFYYKKRAKKVARAAIVHQKRLERMLASEDHLEKPELSYQMKLEFLNTPPSGQDVLVLKDLGKRFGDHLLFEHVTLTLRRQERIVLVGPNGTGKTTLLRLITSRDAPSEGGIQRGANVRLGYFSQEQESLDPRLTPLETVRRAAALSETDARRFLHFFLFAGDDVFVKVGSLSYGERARLALGTLVLGGCNLLLLDEPINHLDIPSRERFEKALATYEGTVLAVVHDRYFIERFAGGIWSIEDHTIHRYVDLDDLRRGNGDWL